MKKLFIISIMMYLISSEAYGYQVLAAPINVANLNGTATANSSYSTYTADLAIDGNTTNASKWVAPDHGTTSDPNWLTVDLGSNYFVNSIELFWIDPDGFHAGYTNNYSLYYGFNNSSWTLAGSGVFVDETPAIYNNFNFGSSGLEMRYVKYEVNGGTHWSVIQEVKVWTESSISQVPEPSTILLLSTMLAGLFIYRKRIR